ncbi:hypothetical protein MKW92_023489 [Papaver armeniacum]|nr:hypothetical protein MKW92_023489 [Papaver armeniacum]
MDTTIQQPDDTITAINNQNSTRGKEDFDWRPKKKSELSEEEKKMEEERTKDNFDSLDDISKIGFTLATMVFFGITLGNFRNFNERDECDVGPAMVKMILDREVMHSFFFLLPHFLPSVPNFSPKGSNTRRRIKSRTRCSGLANAFLLDLLLQDVFC